MIRGTLMQILIGQTAPSGGQDKASGGKAVTNGMARLTNQAMGCGRKPALFRKKTRKLRGRALLTKYLSEHRMERDIWNWTGLFCMVSVQTLMQNPQGTLKSSIQHFFSNERIAGSRLLAFRALPNVQTSSKGISFRRTSYIPSPRN